MNPLAIELAIKSALSASAFPTEPIYCGTSYDELTPESTLVVVTVGQIQRVAGQLFNADVTVKVTAPALLGADSLAQFNALISSATTGISQDYMLAHWPSANAPDFVGLWHQSTATSQNAHEWVVDVSATFGVMTH